jgi:RNA polymerase sigma-70 factor (ECF subfamily)
MQTKEDSFYISSILAGNISDFAVLVNKYKDMVYTLAYRIVGNREDAEELAQDVFVKVHRSLKDFRGKSKFSTWLYSIAYNTSISKVRKKQIESVSLNNHNNKSFDIIDSSYEEQYNFDKVPVELLKQALDELNPVDKTILTLYYQDDKPVKEISKVTGITESNVKVRLHRSRQKLFQKLKLLFKEELTDLL